jgi:hypothetical protein
MDLDKPVTAPAYDQFLRRSVTAAPLAKHDTVNWYVFQPQPRSGLESFADSGSSAFTL